MTSSSATLNGTVNANGLSTTAWFNYGTSAGSYTSTSTTQSVSGSSYTLISIGIGGLSPDTTYYYRIAAQNIIGITYGDEMSFTTVADTIAPFCSISINNGVVHTNNSTVSIYLNASDNIGVTGYYISEDSTVPSTSDDGWTAITSTTDYQADVTYTLSNDDGSNTVYVWFKDASGNISDAASDSILLDTTAKGIISGFVFGIRGFSIESVKIRLKRSNSRVLKKTFSDEDGFFEFTDLDADTYIITALKSGYKTVKQTITLEEREEEYIWILMKKTGRKRTVKDL